MLYNNNGSWSDAGQACDSVGAKLWAINSFAEWWHLSSSFGIATIDADKQLDLNVDLVKLSSTVLLFIGQKLSHQVGSFQ